MQLGIKLVDKEQKEVLFRRNVTIPEGTTTLVYQGKYYAYRGLYGYQGKNIQPHARWVEVDKPYELV